MDETVRFLMVEDVATDAELARREIRQTFRNCDFICVETREEYLTALKTFQPDIIISDYSLPHFDGLSALKLALEVTPSTPVIILTGAINEDTAVECMKAGAADYVIKEHIKRLGQAVTHALNQKQLRLERLQAETALRESEERYRTLVRTLPDATTVTDPFGNITYVSPGTVQFYGYESEDEILGHHILEWVHVDYHEKALDQMLQVLAGDLVTTQEYILLKKDGSRIFSEVSGACLKDTQDQVSGLVIIARDVSARKQAEEEVHYQANLLQNVSDAIIATDMNFRITSWNQTAARLYGWSADEVMGKPVDTVLPSELPGHQSEQIYQQLLERGIWKGETIQKHKDGTRINILTSVSLIKDSTDKTVGMVAVNRDITERKQAEEAQTKLEQQLRQAQKLESIGQLAGGIAHDFNNVMGAIVLYSQLLGNNSQLTERERKYLATIDQQAKHATNLIQQILDFSRRSVIQRSPVDLVPFVQDIMKLLGRTLPENIQIRLALEEETYLVSADSTRLQQALMNLAINASHAMPSGGNLQFSLFRLRVNEDGKPPLPGMHPGEWISISVADTGIGIAPEAQSHIFEPFFTTKSPDKGTGLGLSQVHGVVEQHGGHISFHSEVGHGTTFVIYLPALADAPMTPLAINTSESATSGSETILLVEDNDSVRDAIFSILSDLGYQVLCAADGQEALDLYKARTTPIDLVLSDLVMPRMGGIELCQALQQQYAGIKTVIMSGYPLEDKGRNLLRQGTIAWIQKPFDRNQIAYKLHTVLTS